MFKHRLFVVICLLAAIAVLAACSSAAPTPTLAPTKAPPTAALPSQTPAAKSTPIPVEVLWNINGGPNPFNRPTGLAVDPEGILYVVDAGNSRIQKFDKDGKFILMWGKQGAGDGEFNFHRNNDVDLGGVAVDSQGNVYVADMQNRRVQKFDSNGSFLLKWGSQGNEDGQFLSALDVAVDGRGNVYVIDDYRDDVQKFDPNGNFLLKFGGDGSGDGQFENVGLLTVDAQGNVYVADMGNYRVQKFDSSGTFLMKWGSKGTADNQFTEPSDVAVDDQGNVYVSNLAWNLPQPRIQEFDSNGNFLARWGILGQGDGEFSMPYGIAVDSEGNVYVSDYGNHNVQKFRLKESFAIAPLY
ncbi:6-bladed beta-propeller [Chloroflexi bacterium CFX2]|nr:6-bladed beta-propeller [Chloroflexi bacterium CFX2]